MNVNEIATRPDVGGMGRPIELRSNFFEIGILKATPVVVQYHVEIHHPGARKLDRLNFEGLFFRNTAIT